MWLPWVKPSISSWLQDINRYSQASHPTTTSDPQLLSQPHENVLAIGRESNATNQLKLGLRFLSLPRWVVDQEVDWGHLMLTLNQQETRKIVSFQLQSRVELLGWLPGSSPRVRIFWPSPGKVKDWEPEYGSGKPPLSPLGFALETSSTTVKGARGGSTSPASRSQDWGTSDIST